MSSCRRHVNQVWDLGGQTSIRPYWRCYYPNTDAIIFVVDSCDVDRLGVAKQELMAMLEEDELKDAILLVFANKQDLPGALSQVEITKLLDLETLAQGGRHYTIQSCSAVTGDGLVQGVDWLVRDVASRIFMLE